MAVFIDAAGNEWNLEFDVEAIRRVRKDTGFAFGTCLNDDMKPLNDMVNDFELLPAVMFSLLKDQIQQKGLAELTFVNNVKGDAIESAQRAIWSAFAFFCPKNDRELLTAIQEATDKMAGMQMEKATEMMRTYIEKQSSSAPSSESSQDLTPIAS